MKSVILELSSGASEIIVLIKARKVDSVRLALAGAGGVDQLAERLPAMHEACAPHPAPPEVYSTGEKGVFCHSLAHGSLSLI